MPWSDSAEVPKDCHVINFTIILFQALCPIKLAFLEGQARMIAVSHYIRQIVPGEHESTACIETIKSYIPTTSMGEWSVSKTGSVGLFRLVVPSQFTEEMEDELVRLAQERADEMESLAQKRANEMEGLAKESGDEMEGFTQERASELTDKVEIVARDRAEVLLSDLHSISDQCCQAVDIAEKSHFYHQVSQVISQCDANDVRLPKTIRDIELFMLRLKKVIVGKFLNHIPIPKDIRDELSVLENDGAKTEHLCGLLLKGVAIPSLGTADKLSELKILMCVCAAVMANPNSRIILEELVTRNWKTVFLPERTVEGTNIEKFHFKTYISKGAEPNFFETELFKVSLRVECNSFVCP
jgi:hypothetical protein